MKISSRLSGALMCVTGMAVLGSSVALSRLILDYPTLTGQALRYAVAAAVLAGLTALHARWVGLRSQRGPTAGNGTWQRRPDRLRPSRADLLRLTLLAATGLAGFNVCLLTALRHADAALVGTVIGAAPLGLAVAGPLLRGGRPAVRLVLAAGVVVSGAGLVRGGGHTDALGLLAALGAFVGEVCFSLLAAAVLPRLGAVRVTTWGCALAVPMLLVAAVPAGELGQLRLPTGVEAATLAYLAIVLTVGVFLIWYTGLMRLGVERAGMFVGLLPVTTLVTAALLDRQVPHALQALGVATVAAGLAIGLTARTPAPTPPDLRHTAAELNSGATAAAQAALNGAQSP